MLSYHHMLKNTGNKVFISALYKEEVLPMGFTWQQHLEEWEKNEFNVQVLWVKYEDLITDKLSCLKKVATFLNLKKSEEELLKVSKLSSFKHLKAWRKGQIE
jgi:hypothetical protein